MLTGSQSTTPLCSQCRGCGRALCSRVTTWVVRGRVAAGTLPGHSQQQQCQVISICHFNELFLLFGFAKLFRWESFGPGRQKLNTSWGRQAPPCPGSTPPSLGRGTSSSAHSAPRPRRDGQRIAAVGRAGGLLDPCSGMLKEHLPATPTSAFEHSAGFMTEGTQSVGPCYKAQAGFSRMHFFPHFWIVSLVENLLIARYNC